MGIQEFQQAHESNDLDFEPASMHHSLGKGSNQAAPGTHNHDEQYSDINHNHDEEYALRSNGTPLGTIIMYPEDATAPDDSWLSCDGGTFSSVDYPLLAAKLGDKFGAHAGTTYYKPDFRGRFPRGTSSGTINEGDTGGAETHVIAKANVPPHVHSIGHTHTVNSRTTAGGFGTSPTAAQPTATGTATTLPTSAASTGSSGDASGDGLGNTPVNHMNPWLGIVFLIKARMDVAL